MRVNARQRTLGIADGSVFKVKVSGTIAGVAAGVLTGTMEVDNKSFALIVTSVTRLPVVLSAVIVTVSAVSVAPFLRKVKVYASGAVPGSVDSAT